jgi:chromosome segregation ATPase
MNPLLYIEKWINEHGSATVLREHVALLKSQMEVFQMEKSSLESRFKNTEAERDAFKTKAQALELQLKEAQAEINRYQQASQTVVASGSKRIVTRDSMRGL